MSEDQVKRPYHSPARAAKARATRRRIRGEAQRLFLRDGYAATSMAAIAAQARVAERTLYLAFPTKAALLDEIIRVAVRGHDRDEPLRAGAAFQAIHEAPPGELIGRLAEASTALLARTARVLAIGEAAAIADPALGELRDRSHAATRSDLHEVALALHRRRELGAHLTVEEAGDVLFAVAANEALYLRLVDECGWTQDRYAALLRRLLAGLFA